MWIGLSLLRSDMFVEITDDNVIVYVAGLNLEIAPTPEALSPIAFADVFELFLYFP